MGLPRRLCPHRQGFVPCFREPAPGSAAKTSSRKKTGERFPLDHPRQPSRSPAGRPFRAIG
ncbi:MAG: hypothetical protein DI526_16470 [Caulobacter segnis]|uniref:Uncharacterized protein n=1 Tax=Caulobacter segnis TaxID=88688 RepID=A0A2W5UXF1_9CAUL|nr:MAG: hypothetical protein DI526_16470 [Caulobacter segnis]